MIIIPPGDSSTIFELVKNARDADATSVEMTFENMEESDMDWLPQYSTALPATLMLDLISLTVVTERR